MHDRLARRVVGERRLLGEILVALPEGLPVIALVAVEQVEAVAHRAIEEKGLGQGLETERHLMRPLCGHLVEVYLAKPRISRYALLSPESGAYAGGHQGGKCRPLHPRRHFGVAFPHGTPVLLGRRSQLLAHDSVVYLKDCLHSRLLFRHARGVNR